MVWERVRKRLSSRSTATPATVVTRQTPIIHLPTPLTTFIGREHEVAEVARLLRCPEVRLLTLTGPGGIGKTRLAITAAGMVQEGFPDGVVFVGLAPLRGPDLVVPTIAASLGLQEGEGRQFLDVLIDYLAERQLLLVLDNVEHVLDAAQSIAVLLSGAPSLAVLATSRIALHLSGEHLYDVPTLGVPDPQTAPDLDGMSQIASVRLFSERARRALHDFQLSDTNIVSVATICQRLDGLPLAIELAAARLRTLPLAMLIDRLNHRLPFLTGGPRDLPARQQTLRDTIAWSYDLLPADERRLFRRLSVFRGGWTQEAAVAVAAGDRMQDALDGLERLVEQSLIRIITQPDGTARYSMLETIREFGLEQLIDTGEEESVRQQHACYLLDLVEALEQLYDGPEQIAALDQLEQEHANIRAALDWFVARGEAERGLRLAGSLWMFWQFHGHLSDGRRQYERLLALPQSNVPPRVIAHALTGAGVLAEWQGDYDATVAFQEEALSIWLDLPLADQYDAWGSFSCLGDVAHTRGDLAGAQARYEEVLAHARRVGNARGVAGGCLLLGTVAASRGSLDDAVRLFEISRTHASESGDVWLLAMSTGNLANTQLLFGDIDGARPHFEAALEMLRRMGHKRQMASCLINLGWIAFQQGQTEAAATLLDEAVALANQIGARQESAYAFSTLGEVARQSGDLDRAEDMCREALRISSSITETWLVIVCLETIAAIAADRGDWERAVRLCGVAEQQRKQFTFPMPPVDLLAYERLLNSIRRHLTARDIERVRAEGWAMSLDAAVAYALEPAPAPPSMAP